MITRANFFTSGWNYSEDECDLKSKFQMINIAIVLSTIGLLTGVISNIIYDISGFITLELVLVITNVILFILLRYQKTSLKLVSLIETGQFTLLFLVLI